MRKVLNPLRWTAVTWFAVLLWLSGAIPLNYPPSMTYDVDPATGEFVNPTSYTKIQDYRFPVGWPLHYVEPDDPSLRNEPVPAPSPPIVPGPSSVSYVAAAINASLILLTLFCLVYLSQTFFPRFALLPLLALPALICIYMLCARLIALGLGFDDYWWFDVAVYFSPLLITALYAFRVHSFRQVSTPNSGLWAIQDAG